MSWNPHLLGAWHDMHPGHEDLATTPRDRRIRHHRGKEGSGKRAEHEIPDRHSFYKDRHGIRHAL